MRKIDGPGAGEADPGDCQCCVGRCQFSFCHLQLHIIEYNSKNKNYSTFDLFNLWDKIKIYSNKIKWNSFWDKIEGGTCRSGGCGWGRPYVHGQIWIFRCNRTTRFDYLPTIYYVQQDLWKNESFLRYPPFKILTFLLLAGDARGSENQQQDSDKLHARSLQVFSSNLIEN